MSDPYRKTPNTGEFPIKQWLHGEASPGYPPTRRPNLHLLTRTGSGVTWAQTTRTHPVPVFHTGRFRRVTSPPGRPGRTPGEGNVTSYAG